MAVYIDDMEAPYRGMLMCHMVADSRKELLGMVDLIGVERKWIQKEGTSQEHFDICLTKKAMAVKHGAKAITKRELVAIIKRRRLAKVEGLNWQEAQKVVKD